MGQYWKTANLDKQEYIHPHKLGAGLKLWEQLASAPGTGAALIVLCAAMPTPRGGGDLDLEDNWHGPERTFPEHDGSPGPMPKDYPTIARRTIGRWAGDRIVLVGDYAEDNDISVLQVRHGGVGASEQNDDPPLSSLYGLLDRHWTDITDDVCRVIEHELGGRFVGDGWRTWEEQKETTR